MLALKFVADRLHHGVICVLKAFCIETVRIVLHYFLCCFIHLMFLLQSLPHRPVHCHGPILSLSTRRWCLPPSNGVVRNASTHFTAVSKSMILAPNANTFASLCSLERRAIVSFVHSAARTS